MRRAVYIVITAILVSSFIDIDSAAFSAYAQEEESALEQVTDKQKDYQQQQLETKPEPAASKSQERFTADFYIGVAEGYDNNILLDSSRKGDSYDEVSGGVGLRYKINDALTLKSDIDSIGTSYHEFTDYSMVDNNIDTFLEYYPYDITRIRLGHNIDFINYPLNENASLISRGAFLNARYYIFSGTYAGAGYRYQYHDYDKRKIFDSVYRRRELTREDDRHKFTGEFAHIFENGVFLKVKDTYTFNESNDGYMDYYDYQSNAMSTFATYSVTEKFELVGSASYQRRYFKSRVISTSSTTKEKDELLSFSGGMYYYVMPAVSINISYSYRKNNSNDPAQEYSGGISSAGLQYYF